MIFSLVLQTKKKPTIFNRWSLRFKVLVLLQSASISLPFGSLYKTRFPWIWYKLRLANGNRIDPRFFLCRWVIVRTPRRCRSWIYFVSTSIFWSSRRPLLFACCVALLHVDIHSRALLKICCRWSRRRFGVLMQTWPLCITRCTRLCWTMCRYPRFLLLFLSARIVSSLAIGTSTCSVLMRVRSSNSIRLNITSIWRLDSMSPSWKWDLDSTFACCNTGW